MITDRLKPGIWSQETKVIALLTVVTLSVSLNWSASLFLVPKISLDYGNVIAQWGVIIQSVFIVSLYLFFGKIGDLIGLCSLCRMGSGIMAIGFFCCFLSTTGTGYLLATACMGIGIAMFSSVSNGIIKNIVPPDRISRAFSMVFIGYGIGFILGPLVLAWIEMFYSWDLFYALLTPFPLVLVLFLGRILDCRPHRTSLKKVDVPGAILLMLTLIFLYIPLIEAFQSSFTQFGVQFIICAGICAIILFWHERATKTPFLDLGFFKRKGILPLILVLMVMVLLYRCYLFYVQIYLDEIDNFSTQMVGMYLLIPGISFFPLAVCIGYYGYTWSRERFIHVCLVGCGIGIIGIFMHGVFSLLYPVIALLFFGAYNACIRIASYTLYFLRVSKEEAGYAGGLMETGIAFINPLVIPLTGFFFHYGFLLYTPDPLCWQKIPDGFSWGNLGVSLFLICGIIVQIFLLLGLKKQSRSDGHVHE